MKAQTAIVVLTSLFIACGDETDDAAPSTTYTPPGGSIGGSTGGGSGSTGGGSSGGGGTSTNASLVCIYQHSSRFACPGVTNNTPAKWECASWLHTLTECRQENASDTSCDGDCCTSHTYWGHQVVAGPCTEALARVSGTSGGGSTGGGSSGTNTCEPFRGGCNSHGDCCSGLICVNWGTSAICSYPCDSGSDCNGGCCAPLQSGGGVCANPETYCSG